MDEQELISTELKRIGRDLAATRLLLALSRLERKYLDQPRWGAHTVRQGNQGPGYFAAKDSGAPSVGGKLSAARALGALVIENPGLAAAGVATAGTLTGSAAIAVARGAGYYSRTGGGGATPFLGQPLTLMGADSGIGRPAPRWSSPEEANAVHEQCEKVENLDRLQCVRASKAPDIPVKDRAAFLRQCLENASTRYADCVRKDGQPSDIPLLSQWWGKEFRGGRDPRTPRIFTDGGKKTK